MSVCPTLTTIEKYIIKSTWAEMKKDVHELGYDIMIRFFDANPSYQSWFGAFKNVPPTQLRGNKPLLAHAANVVYALSLFVDTLDDTELLIEMFKKLARNHAKNKISVQMFENLRPVFIRLLQDKLGSGVMNDEAIAAWHKTYTVLMFFVVPVLEGKDDI